MARCSGRKRRPDDFEKLIREAFQVLAMRGQLPASARACLRPGLLPDLKLHPTNLKLDKASMPQPASPGRKLKLERDDGTTGL
jgi:hypothetical protein